MQRLYFISIIVHGIPAGESDDNTVFRKTALTRWTHRGLLR